MLFITYILTLVSVFFLQENGGHCPSVTCIYSTTQHSPPSRSLTPPSMDGLIEQNSVLMHNKITEAGKRNGLINTRNLVAESRDGLVSVYPTPQYQSHRAGSSPSCLENGRNDPVQQLLDPNMLQQTVESHYRPNIILYSENVLRSWGESINSECCETTFIEDRSPTKDSLEYPDSKFIDLSADDIKIHTLSYDVEEEEDFQELEVRCHVGSVGEGMSGLKCTASGCWFSWHQMYCSLLQPVQGAIAQL